MARTPRPFSRRSHAEAKAGENIEQGKPREDVTEKAEENKSAGKDLRGLTDSEFAPRCGGALVVAPLAQQ